MNALLDPLRQVARDLVAKKLWPLAVLLVIAIVAVPVMIGSSSEDTSAPAPVATAPATEAGTHSLVTAVEPAVTGAGDDRPGKLDDPFYDPPKPPAEPSSSSGTAPATGATPSSGTTPTEPTNPANPTTPAEPVVKPVYYRTEVRWYETTKGKPQPISRLTPFGGLVDTAALYLGVTKSDGVYAVFLLGPGATSDGEAKCEDALCRVMGLQSGQTQLVTVQPADGSAAHQYTLEVVSVRTVETSAAFARHMRAKVHPDGRDVMRSMWEDGPTAEALRPVQFDRSTGLLVKGATEPSVAKAAFKGRR
jgi:hypothetical protein